MKLYEECRNGLGKLLEQFPVRHLEKTSQGSWPDEGKNQLIFQSDMAYELGGGKLPALSGILFTDREEEVPEDEILLYGKDLPALTEDTAYARVAIVRIRQGEKADTNALYQMFRRIDYSRYHLNPRGYMMRISALNQREVVRVGKAALTEGLSFAKVGELFLQAYHKHPEVEAVKLVFVTLPEFSYKEASDFLEKAENITKTLDHLMKKVQMDCHACSLKEVCAEVEALCNEETK